MKKTLEDFNDFVYARLDFAEVSNRLTSERLQLSDEINQYEQAIKAKLPPNEAFKLIDNYRSSLTSQCCTITETAYKQGFKDALIIMQNI